MNQMTNAASQLPTWLQGRQSLGLANRLAGNLGAGSPPYVSIMGGRFTLIDAAGNQTPVPTYDPAIGVYLDCTIVDVGDHVSKIYYAKPFDPNEGQWQPPDCWSDNGVAPSVNASSPQARSCTPDETGQHGCRWAVWGSATSKITGKGVPACSTQQKLALVIPGYDHPWLLRVPPISLTTLREYIQRFVGQPVGMEMVVTRISFDIAQGAKLGTLLFNAVGWVDQAMMPLLDSLATSHATDGMVGRLDQPRQAALPPPATATIAGPGFSSGPVQMQPMQAPPPNPTPPAPAHSAGWPSTAGAQAPIPTGQLAPAASPSEAPRRRGRRPAAQQAPAAPPQQPVQQFQQPAQPAPAQPAPFQPAPFRPAPTASGAGVAAGTAPSNLPAQAPFGLAASVPPNPELKGMLDQVFGQNAPGASR